MEHNLYLGKKMNNNNFIWRNNSGLSETFEQSHNLYRVTHLVDSALLATESELFVLELSLRNTRLIWLLFIGFLALPTALL